VSLVSDINPDEYADAEWSGGEEGIEDGVVGDESGIIQSGVEKAEDTSGAETIVNGMSGGTAENGTSGGQEGEGVEDTYIDDGAAAEEAAIGRVASMSLVAAVASSGTSVPLPPLVEPFIDTVPRCCGRRNLHALHR
jgi:hypothetical protein